ncbi:MAG TPA: hypothetical protein VOA41_07550 [Candidatus Dormibacteraeota bacterium]|nr:hypothetical protein [Candidatus Dormibacteraeota bacterium]
MKKIRTSDYMWVVALIVMASIVLPNYIARELFAAMLLFSVLFFLAAAILGTGVVAWHMAKRFTDWEPLRNLASGIRRFTEEVWSKTLAG